MNSWLIITDLDGTLLDAKTYAWEAHRGTLDELKQRGIPVVLCTSKTRAETEVLRHEMGNTDPFIVESGGGVIMGEKTIALGRPYGEVLAAFQMLKRDLPVRGFSDMTAEELARESGMTLAQARLAKERVYDEPFLCTADPTSHVEALGFRCTRGGRYWHLHGDTDKGRAVRALLQEWGPVTAVGVGDSPLDMALLEACHVRVAIARPDGSYDEVLVKTFPDVHCYLDWSAAIRALVLSGS